MPKNTSLNVEAFNDLLALLHRVRGEPLLAMGLGDDKLKKVEFNMWQIVGTSSVHDCGAAACAIGHLCLDPVLSVKYGITNPKSGCFDLGGYWVDWENGASRIFGIETTDVRHLFSPWAYRGEDEEDEGDIAIGEVIERIEDYLEERGVR